MALMVIFLFLCYYFRYLGFFKNYFFSNFANQIANPLFLTLELINLFLCSYFQRLWLFRKKLFFFHNWINHITLVLFLSCMWLCCIGNCQIFKALELIFIFSAIIFGFFVVFENCVFNISRFLPIPSYLNDEAPLSP